MAEKLRKYETLFVIHPDHTDAKDEIVEKISQIIQQDGGEVLKQDDWGMRKLAYPIEKKRQGYYYLMEFAAPAQTPPKLEQTFRIDERIMRFIVVKLDEKYEPETLAA
ncbi:ribosomal protein S6 [Thermodesulfatator indicus DSM 15286]|uniref:Small ribosomal subunit protein bS6 n=1 Tax=Thermodesulfatator indicus (strain DSM 15286 / JCM 11887 / CIR29812) TaxID=667014 RepID=F8AB91_THEID|nr:30S ribosomal protein S6 [Thermodesulfatator indicus]AEH45548.1 ribosomal protein S6 [Thermodesulfatator indicus DSM 15286]